MVVAGATAQDVLPVQPPDHVIARTAEDDVVLVGPLQHVVTVGADDRRYQVGARVDLGIGVAGDELLQRQQATRVIAERPARPVGVHRFDQASRGVVAERRPLRPADQLVGRVDLQGGGSAGPLDADDVAGNVVPEGERLAVVGGAGQLAGVVVGHRPRLCARGRGDPV